MGERRDVYRILVGKPVGKIPLGRPRYGWEDNIKIDLPEVGWRGMDWIDLAQNKGWYANAPAFFIISWKYLDLVEDLSAF